MEIREGANSFKSISPRPVVRYVSNNFCKSVSRTRSFTGLVVPNSRILSKNNIFDIAGSTAEWTQERVNSKQLLAVVRGGTNVAPRRIKPMADRTSRAIYRKDPYIGFRVALYIP